MRPFFRSPREVLRRAKGPKLLNYAQVACDALTVSEPALFQRYDRIYAIDTNTHTDRGSACVSVSAIHMATIEPFNYSISLAKVGLVSLPEFRDVGSKPENVAWRTAIELIQGSPSIAADFRIGIIVDSDLGVLSATTIGRCPIEGDFYLPELYTLIYASADIGRDQMSNKLIALSDKESRRLLDYLLPSQMTTKDWTVWRTVPIRTFDSGFLGMTRQRHDSSSPNQFIQVSWP